MCLSNFYIDNLTYQENELVRKHVELGHEVKVLASTEVFDDKKKLAYVKPTSYLDENNVEIVRIPYLRYLPLKIATKLRVNEGVMDFLKSYSPDVIMFHSMCGWELITVSRYIKKNPHVIVYFDSHEDFNNSARGFVSKYILHSLYYKPIARYASKFCKKILCISYETMDFMFEFYGISKEKLEFYPLGGNIKSSEDYNLSRRVTRELYDLAHDEVMLLQSGKFTERKKLLSSLKAFLKNDNLNLRLFVVGVLDESVREDALKLIDTDVRIIFLGWKSPIEMDALLDAADVYLQPGSQSVTLQASMCAKCAVVIDKVKSHEPYLHGNGWYANDVESLTKVFDEISTNPIQLVEMSEKSYEIAARLLDYKKLAERVLK